MNELEINRTKTSGTYIEA